VCSKPISLWKGFICGVVLWVIGFVWGVIVFAVPALKDVPTIHCVSKFPGVSSVLIVAYIFLLIHLSRNYLREATVRSKECLILGTVILLVTVVLDTLVYVLLLASPDYFAYLSVWISYALFVGVPWIIGRHLQ
jgi:hypothetical protein